MKDYFKGCQKHGIGYNERIGCPWCKAGYGFKFGIEEQKGVPTTKEGFYGKGFPEMMDECTRLDKANTDLINSLYFSASPENFFNSERIFLTELVLMVVITLFCCSNSLLIFRGRSSESIIPFINLRYVGRSSFSSSVMNTRRT